MLCELCKKSQATVHLTEIVNDEMAELHLCDTCANEKGAQVESNFGLSDLLSGLTDYGRNDEEEERSNPVCENCGMSYEEFRKIGRLGCSVCYDTFASSLGSLLKRIHGSPVHLGKAPGRFAKPDKGKSTMGDLRSQLETAIEREDFEQAAVIRDQIRRYQQKKAKDE